MTRFREKFHTRCAGAGGEAGKLFEAAGNVVAAMEASKTSTRRPSLLSNDSLTVIQKLEALNSAHMEGEKMKEEKKDDRKGKEKTAAAAVSVRSPRTRSEKLQAAGQVILGSSGALTERRYDTRLMKLQSGNENGKLSLFSPLDRSFFLTDIEVTTQIPFQVEIPHFPASPFLVPPLPDILCAYMVMIVFISCPHPGHLL